MTQKLSALFAYFSLLAFFFLSNVVLASPVGIEKPFCLALKGSPNAAIFMTIRLAEDDVLTEVKIVSEGIADHAELHTHKEVEGVMKMVPLTEMKTENGCLILKRGGLHIMLMGLKKELSLGTKIPLALHFQKAGIITVNVPVESAGWKKEESSDTMCCHCTDE